MPASLATFDGKYKVENHHPDEEVRRLELGLAREDIVERRSSGGGG